MIDVFLSASIPLPERNRHYFETADVLLIREAIKALVEVVLPIGRITCGGHPAITPLIAFFVSEAGLDRNHLTIFQSRLFQKSFPEENAQFIDVRLVDAVGDSRERSLTAMRKEMVLSRNFQAAVFIGGMEGIFEEADLVRALQPQTQIMPIASTGAASADLFQQLPGLPTEFKEELTYATLFRRQIKKL